MQPPCAEPTGSTWPCPPGTTSGLQLQVPVRLVSSSWQALRPHGSQLVALTSRSPAACRPWPLHAGSADTAGAPRQCVHARVATAAWQEPLPLDSALLGLQLACLQSVVAGPVAVHV
jgi:hypothetical protein